LVQERRKKNTSVVKLVTRPSSEEGLPSSYLVQREKRNKRREAVELVQALWRFTQWPSSLSKEHVQYSIRRKMGVQ